MKNSRIFARIVAVIALVAVLASCIAVFAACNKKKTKSISDIFKDRASYGEITSYERVFELESGWEVYTDSRSSSTSTQAVSQYSDVGYIKGLEAFVVSIKEGDNTKLSVMKCNDDSVYFTGGPKGMLFSKAEGIRALRYKDGLFVCLFNDGTAGAFDNTGRVVLSSEKLGGYGNDAYGYANTSNGNIDDIIKVLSGGLIAVNGRYDHLGQQGYTSIYRPTRDGNRNDRGELVCRIKNDGDNLSYVRGFDDRYATVVGNTNASYIFNIPDHAPAGGAQSLEPTTRGTVARDTSKTEYSSEITYIGGGKFYVSEDWKVNEGDDYTYYNGEDYVYVARRIYTPSNDASKEYSSSRIFNNLTNNYYDATKAGIDTNSYLNDGYTYVAFGVTVVETDGVKLGLYDQFIVDADLDIVMSLTGNYGVELKGQKKDSVGFYDLIMYGVDGYYFNPVSPSAINVYDKNSKLVGHNDRSNAIVQEMNNRVMIVQTPNGNSTTTYRYGAYDVEGNELIPFDYSELAPYRGAYTIGKRNGRSGVDGETTGMTYLKLIGPNGKEVDRVDLIDYAGNVTSGEPFSDIAHRQGTSGVNNAIYKAGVYMFYVDTGEKDGSASIYKYGIRNFNPSAESCIVIPARMESGATLYSPSTSPSDLFVFEKVTSADKLSFYYIVYRLI